MRHRVKLALALLLLAACSKGDFGKLEPVTGGEVEQGAKWNEAVVRADGVSATVSAHWASETSQGADVLYVNRSKVAASIALSRLVLHHRLGDAPLWFGSDITGADRSKNNVAPPIIYDLDKPATKSMRLVVKPGEQRFLSIGFTNYPGTERIKAGDRVTMTVPLGSRDATIPFIAR